MRDRAILGVGVGLGVAAFLLVSVDRLADVPPAWPPYGPLAAEVNYLGFLVAGWVVIRRRPGSRIGILMILAAFAILPGVLQWSGTDAIATTRLLSLASWALLAHVCVTYPSGRLERRSEAAVVIYGYVLLLLSLPGRMAVETWPCNLPRCPQNALFMPALKPYSDAMLVPLYVLGLLGGIVVFGIFVRHWRSAGPARRREFTPVLWASLVVVCAFFVDRVLTWTANPSTATDVFFIVLKPAAMVALPIAFAVGILRTQLARGAVGDLLLRFDSLAAPRDLEAAIGQAVGDPTLTVAFWNTDAACFVDAESRPVALPPPGSGRAMVDVGPAEHPVAVLVHDPALLDDPQLIRSVAAAARLALENARLARDLRLTREIPTGLAHRLLASGVLVGQAERREASVLMSDIRGFSSIAQTVDAVALTALLQEHSAAMTDVITRHGGTVMRFLGDAVLAVFGAPEPLDGRETAALAAAAAMHARQAELNGAWAASGRTPFRLGIGVTSGTAAVSVMGSGDYFEYSLVGDVVNLCSRIQQWADGDIVVDGATYDALDPRPPADRLEPATVKGREAPVQAYRIEVRSIDEDA